MTHLRKFMVLVAGLLLVVLAGCTSFSDVAKQKYGIEPGVSYGVLVGSAQTGIAGEGSVFLFFGSITSIVQTSLRIGYTNASGESYLLDLPLKNIEFHTQDPNAEPSAQFTFKGYPTGRDQTATFQDVIDNGIQVVNVTITPDQWEQLVTG